MRYPFRDLFEIAEEYYEPPRIKRGGKSKEYPNKNANIEYYTDEKGNIRKVKKQNAK